MEGTKSRAPSRISVAVVVGCFFVLGGGTAAGAQPPPNPEKLWDAFPLDPEATTPAPEPQTPVTEPTAPAPPPTTTVQERGGETGWSPFVIVALGGSLLLVLAAGLLVQTRRRRPAAARSTGSTEELVARAYVLAAECDMLLASQRDKGVASVSETADHEFPAAQATPNTPASGAYAEIGERVAGVLSAAEAAAEQIRADARLDAEDLLRTAKEDAEQVRREAAAYDNDTRAAVDTFATDRRREAEQQVSRELADAEVQARATREAAEQMALQIEDAGRQRGQALRDESHAVEERLKKALVGLRRMTVQLEELVGAPGAPQTEGESLADALRPYGQRDEELQPLVEER